MWWLCWAATALAADSAVEVRTALASGDVRSARAALELDTSLGRRVPGDADQLAFRYQAQGAVFDLQSRPRDMHEAFRNAWIVAPTGRADRDVLTRPDLVASFEARQSEVFQLEIVDLRWMKLPDNATVRIDGVAMGSQPVFRGRHHVQVQCADQSWSSRWTQFGRAEDWAHACPDGALAPLTTVAATDAAPTVVEIALEPGTSGATTEDRRHFCPMLPQRLPPTGSSRPAAGQGFHGCFLRGIAWVQASSSPAPPRAGCCSVSGCGLGTGAELQLFRGDSGGFFTTLAATHMPLHVGTEGVNALRITAGEVGLGYQPHPRVRWASSCEAARRCTTTRCGTPTDTCMTGAAGARWDAPGTGRFLFVGLAYTGNLARGFVAPRASLGWQF